MTALLLHIGSPKAGSSAIQASLLEAAVDLQQQGLLVLPPNPYRRPLPSGFLAACYLPVGQLPRYLAARQRRDPDRFNRDIQAYLKLLADLLRLGHPPSARRWRARLQRWSADALRRPSQPAVLSSEYLFRLSVEQIRELRRWFEAQGIRRFRVLVYVRDPVSAYSSFLQQWLRLSDDLTRYSPWHWLYPFRKQLEAWASVFAPQELVVRPFSRDQLCGGSVVRDFYNQCSRWFEQPLAGPEPSSVNQSMSIEELTLVQELLQAVPPERRLEADWTFNMAKFLRLLRRQALELDCSQVQLQPWVRQLVGERHAADLDWLSGQYGITFPPASPPERLLSLPDETTQHGLHDLLVPAADRALVEQLHRRQLQAVVRDGLR
ncbi:MAG: hypothetical protein FJ076_08290 [Cyanobacteria bacterium K_DeepCast_35m_m1_288]|nr:hypothetical protein [Cyanobacteria bacterium K_DeepCast_35m_m1_288]